MAADILKLRNMVFYGYHGLLPEENKLGQRFEVDVDIYGNFRGFAHGATDRAVDYPQVYEWVKSVVTGERYGLVESLADRIAEVLQVQMGLDRLVVRVRKPTPPVDAVFDGIEVEVRRGM